MAIVVDEISFASNSHPLMTWFKENLSAQFYIKLSALLPPLSDWKYRGIINISEQHRLVTQSLY